MKTREALSVANTFIALAKEDDTRIDQMKLQKLVYFAHGWHLALRNALLVSDEQVEAWKFGPVFPSVYHAFKSCGYQPVKKPAVRLEFDFENNEFVQHEIGPVPGGRGREIIDAVWKAYRPFSSIQLSNLTHEPGTAWDEINKKYGGQIPASTDIDSELIKREFERRRAKPAGK